MIGGLIGGRIYIKKIANQGNSIEYLIRTLGTKSEIGAVVYDRDAGHKPG